MITITGMKYCKTNNCLRKATNCLDKIYVQETTGNLRQPAPFPKCFINRLFLKFISTYLRVSDVYDHHPINTYCA